jgi:hypothetical protein
MSYSFFNDPEFAGPGPRDVLKFWDRNSRQLRSKPRTIIPKFKFPTSQTYGIPEKATFQDALEISKFWNLHYSGVNWKFDCKSKDVERWMDQGFILVLKETIDNKKQIVTTFVCRIINEGVVCGSHIKQAGILDGFVVHPRLRGHGLASYMLAAMDKEIYNMPTMNQSILIWFREHANSVNSVLQAPVAVFDYSYIKLNDIPKHNSTNSSTPDSSLVKQILNSVYENSVSQFTILSRNFADPDIYWTLVNSSLVGIADTHRISNDGYTFWEVVFAANLEPPYFVNLQIPIEISGLNLPCTKGILFATNSKSRGNLSGLYKPWSSGKSGYLSMHVYNWMPPTFIVGDLFFAHTCI